MLQHSFFLPGNVSSLKQKFTVFSLMYHEENLELFGNGEAPAPGFPLTP